MKLTLWLQDGAKTVEVNRTTGVATITMEEGKTLTREDVEKLFKKTKYKLTEFKHVKGPDLKEATTYVVTLEGLKADESTDELVKQLKAIEGVEDVSLDGSTATIKMKPDKTLTKEAVDGALKDTNYKCAAVEPAHITENKEEETE